MKKAIARLSLLSVIMLALTSLAFANEPANLGKLKKELIRYHDSGEYSLAIAHKIDSAENYLKRRIAEHRRHPNAVDQLAIVLDIDETSLSNYPGMRKMDFGGSNAAIEAQEAEANDPPIRPTLRLFNYARAHNVAVFFVTGRKEKYRQETIKNLHRAGYHGWTKLIMTPNNYHRKSIVPFKANARKHIIDSGYDIVLNVGDQYSDLKQDFADRKVKLPNPFYYLP